MKHNDLRHELSALRASLPEEGGTSPSATTLARVEELQSLLDAIVYPVLDLPTEITQEIFENTVVFSDVGPREPRWWLRPARKLSPTAAPLVLLHVCSTWRQIAITLPALWREMTIRFAGPDRGVAEESLERWPTIVCPSPKVLTFKGDQTGSEAAHARAVLAKHASGVDSLNLCLSFLDVRSLDVEWPSLKRIYLTMMDDSYTIHPVLLDSPLRCFENCPLLEDVTLLYGPRPSNLSLPWQQLTSIMVNEWIDMECYFVLLNCPQLRRARFDDPHQSGAHPLVPTIRHPNMEDFSSSPIGVGFLEKLQFPSLKELFVGEAPRPPFDHLFEPFTLHFASILTSFNYSSHTIPEDDPISIEWFRSLRALEYIQLMRVPDAFTRALLLELDRNKNPEYLPNLGQIIIRKRNANVDLDAVKAIWTRCPCMPYDEFFPPEPKEAEAGDSDSDEAVLRSEEPAPVERVLAVDSETKPAYKTLRAFVLIHHPYPVQDGDPTDFDYTNIGEVDWDALADLLWATEDQNGCPRMAIHVGVEGENFVEPWGLEGDGEREETDGDRETDTEDESNGGQGPEQTTG
uniref:F-box domain-containing protein n=1 Tax=Mycena chlorophos TaxID=658473 RepID=A0ABQ0LHM6_MYCCL|nr:predicted protein [Mycena chlorophos]